MAKRRPKYIINTETHVAHRVVAENIAGSSRFIACGILTSNQAARQRLLSRRQQPLSRRSGFGAFGMYQAGHKLPDNARLCHNCYPDLKEM